MLKSRIKFALGIVTVLIASLFSFATPATAQVGEFPSSSNCLNSEQEELTRFTFGSPQHRVALRRSLACDMIYAEAVGQHNSVVFVERSSTIFGVAQLSGTVNNYYPGVLSKGYSRMLEARATARACIRTTQGDLRCSEWVYISER